MLYDAIVLGLGAMGSAAAWQLARRGRRVLGLDRYPPAHDRGASHGRSRIIREAYFEHPAYVPLVQRAYELWAELERACGRLLLLTTGGIMLGRPESVLVRGALASARTHGLAHELLDGREVRRRFPVFQPDDEMAGVLEPRAGVLFPEEAILAALQEAARAGAELHHEEPVLTWAAGPTGVAVRTARGDYEAGLLVLTPGPWAPHLLAELGLELTVQRQVVPWFRPAALPEAFAPERCPIYIWMVGERLYYGFPQLGDSGVKIAEHVTAGAPTTAETVRREVDPREVEALREAFVRRYMPAADGRLLDVTTCLYTMTPDAHFVIDSHPDHPNVVVACGFSGHGFKFAPVVGEILADLALEGRTAHDIGLFRIARFAAGPRAHGGAADGEARA
ncbi:MAG: N-methyl-L-tryptophan oxidase [Armatimonadota bacterium]|nr:N-methyl-L-tryptophan oxidase [Armatimonadota bacterium]MDR7449529.1 N-methyl-L-tryptophan oxidase [Armatimonadota bacterium]MDR7460712.1 N-methyl-L-tryptophan oxidase [Armatimonadota bacterium]MDR7479703.1 N-methyl-L-tryptophan oxidase [Armatimonadota bacterium]MDR7489104.1 N-methyl-L-tryptophan oxidase [Armatimonadota bacterium]